MKYDLLELLRRPKLTLIMSLPANDPELARVAWAEGADVVKVHINVEHRASKTHFGSFSEHEPQLRTILEEAQGPCGIVAGGDLSSALKDYRAAAEAGFSFVSLYAKHMAPEILRYPLLTKMVALDHNYTLDEAAALEQIGGQVLEASVMDPSTYGQPLSVKELLQYRMICGRTHLPVVVPTQRMIQPEELPALHQCGVSAVMIGAVVTGSDVKSIAGSVSRFRKYIDQME